MSMTFITRNSDTDTYSDTHINTITSHVSTDDMTRHTYSAPYRRTS